MGEGSIYDNETRGYSMSTLKVLKEYLVGEGGYLLNDDNNGKTVMLSGAWGSGKTHFWLQDIDPQLTKENQKNIYISLYGRESIAELKFEVLKEAYNLEVKDDIISKSASMLSTIAPSLGEKSLVDGFDKLNKKAKEKKAEEILKSGSIICLDDFERKSTKIDLNDLFGYISQLALDYKCKVVIILNSDVFEGEEANVFKTVKEKTVNKFFYFEPSIEELFGSIYGSDDKYKRLDEYKAEIVNAIKDTEELNARIYIQVLDNCLEWIDKGYGNNQFWTGLKELVLCTIFFINHHLILSYRETMEVRTYDVSNIFLREGFRNIYHILNNTSLFQSSYKRDNAIHVIYENLKANQGDSNISLSEDLYIKQNEAIDTNKELIYDFIKYIHGFKVDKIEESLFNKINIFINIGILSKKEDIL